VAAPMPELEPVTRTFFPLSELNGIRASFRNMQGTEYRGGSEKSK
jgi:hypothetical protein